MKIIRKPAASGFFYPSNPKKLKEEIELLSTVAKPVQTIQNLLGIIVPHAGYIYSGRTAAYAFNLLKDIQIENVIIISPSHREYFEGISVYDEDAYETPLGVISVNKDLANNLVKDSANIFKSSLGHKQEHAIEVELPFLQVVLKEFKLLPIVMGDQSKKYIDELSNKLSEIIDDKTLIISSSDLSHYHDKTEAYRLDSIVEKRISEFEYDKLQHDLDERNCEACGGGPIVTLMKTAALLKKNNSLILDRSDSSDTSGDESEVVGYLSAAIYGE